MTNMYEKAGADSAPFAGWCVHPGTLQLFKSPEKTPPGTVRMRELNPWLIPGEDEEPAPTQEDVRHLPWQQRLLHLRAKLARRAIDSARR